MKTGTITVTEEKDRGGTKWTREINGDITPRMACIIIEEMWEIAKPDTIHLFKQK